MLLLLILGSVSMVAAEYVEIKNRTMFNISSCPITYYGVEYKTLYVEPAGNLSVCFDAFVGTDCLLFEGGGGSTWKFQIINQWDLVQSRIQEKYYQLALSGKGVFQLGNATCALEINRPSSSTCRNFIIPNAGLIMLLVGYFRGESEDKLRVTVDSVEMMEEEYNWDEPAFFVGGCRRSGGLAPLKLNQTVTVNADKCSTEYCSQTGIVPFQCSADEKCKNLICLLWKEYTCTVTGNTMIDRTGQTQAIANFCPQVLFKNKYMNLTVSYAARRLSDVPLLNYVIFELDDKAIAFRNGLILQFDNMITEMAGTMNLSAKMEFSRVPGGILGTMARDDFYAEVFNDGTTLHIHYEGSPEHVDGLHMCADNSEPITRAVIGCDQVDSDPRGDSIDCGAATERCKSMFKKAFTNCSVDPEPYITACTNLFCNYTDTDDMMCRVLEAYARHCPAEDWMDSVGCAPSRCTHEKCLDHEFCGLSLGRRPLCLCRAPFAAPYRTNNTFGEDTMCVAKKASVSLIGCLLAEQNIDMSTLHLNDPNCTGTINPKTKDVTFTFSDTNHCAANVSVKGNKIIYSNTIMAPEDNGETISRSSPVSIQFSCTYTQPEVHTMSLKIKDRSVVKVIDEGEWTYVFNMTAFLDEDLGSPLTDESNLHLDDMLWIQTKVSEVDEQLISLVIEECWATKENNAEAEPKYSLVKKGCSDEDSVTMKSNGESLASVFSFRVFQFLGSEDDVYIHCETKLCIKADGCTKACPGP